MNYRKFGNTDLIVSEVGFGAWGIGGPSMAGDIPIGWGEVNDDESINALRKSFDLGINFYDSADFYGLGHSEELIGEVFGNSDKVIIATKVGHRLNNDNSIALDYSKKHILHACESSLKRLKRDSIDYYQLHSAKISHLENGECIEAMEQLTKDGKIRYWGISLNTFNPFPEAEFFLKNKIGNGFQLVFNVINQRAHELFVRFKQNGYGIIARMPLQFGLLTGKFGKDTKFPRNDHRQFRLTPDVLSNSLDMLKELWTISESKSISKTSLSLSFILAFDEVSTVIPGIKNTDQAVQNTSQIVSLDYSEKNYIVDLYKNKLHKLVDLMEKQG